MTDPLNDEKQYELDLWYMLKLDDFFPPMPFFTKKH